MMTLIFISLFFLFLSQTFVQSQPTSFDWRDYGCVTSVKNQGSGNTGWVYAVLGSYEGAILVDNGPNETLSVQFLLDNLSGTYDYSNGDWGFSYMVDGTPRSGSYSAGGLADLPGCFKGYPLSCWRYVDSATAVPSTTDLKQAIYNYGPVCAAVYVSAYFQNYTGGIFSYNGTGTVNHGVVLVGWDDIGGYWIAKNSWGTYWGESGYIRIAYGCSQIGYGAAYGIPANHSCLSPNVWYKFVSRFNNNVLDVGAGSYVYQAAYDGGYDKQWEIVPVGSGWVKIENRSSGYTLDVSGSTDYVYQYAYNGNPDKHWDIIYHDSGYYKVYNRFTTDYLSLGALNYIYHYPWNGNADRQWEISVAYRADTRTEK